MIFNLLKKQIASEKAKLEKGKIIEEEYSIFKEQTMNKLDVFLATNRITQEQYEELAALLG